MRLVLAWILWWTGDLLLWGARRLFRLQAFLDSLYYALKRRSS